MTLQLSKKGEQYRQKICRDPCELNKKKKEMKKYVQYTYIVKNMQYIKTK